MATEHTRLIYVTTGVLLRKLVQTKSLTEYTHIFVDEVHKHEVYVVKCIKIMLCLFIHFESCQACCFGPNVTI